MACCVSDLLGEQPLIRSGREANYEVGKDTGRFWDAGAANVHWVIATDDQIELGIDEALSRVKAPGVIVEGNGFLEYIEADTAVMCARADGGTIKRSARDALLKSNFLYLSSLDQDSKGAREQFQKWCANLKIDLSGYQLPILTREDLPTLAAHLRTSQ